MIASQVEWATLLRIERLNFFATHPKYAEEAYVSSIWPDLRVAPKVGRGAGKPPSAVF
jgi:hypothetical protein